jgi:hypothetical protein
LSSLYSMFQVECSVAKQNIDDLKRRPITAENKAQ